MEPFDNKQEVLLLRVPHVYDNNAKNISKRVLQSCLLHLIHFKNSRNNKLRSLAKSKYFTFDYDEDNSAAARAWVWYRIFNMRKVHDSLHEFLQEVKISHREATRDEQWPAIAMKLISLANEDYPYFKEIIKLIKNKSSLIPGFQELKRVFLYWCRLLPLTNDVIIKIKFLRITNSYLENLFYILEEYWEFLRALPNKTLMHYYIHIFCYRKNFKGFSQLAIDYLPEGPRPFKEFLLDLRIKYNLNILLKKQ